MAHFAQLDPYGFVVRVIVVADDDAPTENAGIAFCKALFGANTTWKQTSYNTREGKHPQGKPFRKNYAGVGYEYDSVRDAFIPPKPVDGNTRLNESTCEWEPV